MPTMLSTGSTVRLETYGISCTVDRLLGAGGQGEVYLVSTVGGSGPNQYALKWYYPGWATREQLEALHALIRLDSPSPKFLWPIDVAMGGPGGFGYVMELRPPQFHGIVELMLANISPTFRALATAAFQFADGFLQLHTAGLCYRDISFGNAFINADNGDVLICDNDNVGIDGRAPVGVRGTDLFITGDGGFMFGVQELSTAVQFKIGVVTLVFNNNAYGNVRRDQRQHFDGRVVASDLVNPDFVKLAESFGVGAARVTSPDHFRPALEKALADGGPYVISVEVPTDSEVSPWAFIHPAKPKITVVPGHCEAVNPEPRISGFALTRAPE